MGAPPEGRGARSPGRSAMRIKLLAFARVRELLGYAERDVDLPANATLDDLWRTIGTADLEPLRRSTRFARNGSLVDGAAPLADGDEVALLPPVGGG